MKLNLNANNPNLDNQDIQYGYVLEVQIVDHCNLNCANCNHFSSIAKEYYLPINIYHDQMILLKQKLPQLKRLVLIGGEPFLHPNIVEFCEISRELFNNVEIHILTNGLKLKTLDKKILFRLKELQIKICVSKYIGINDNLEQELNKENYYDILYPLSRKQSIIPRFVSKKNLFADQRYYHHHHRKELASYYINNYVISQQQLHDKRTYGETTNRQKSFLYFIIPSQSS